MPPDLQATIAETLLPYLELPAGSKSTVPRIAEYVAAQVVAALGLREEWGVRYSAHTEQAWDQRFPDREAAEREVQDSLGPKPEVTHVVLVGRHATDWSTP